MSNNSTPQIFQTNKPTRWKSVKWTVRVLLLVSIFFIAVLGIALYSGSLPNLPNMEAKAREYRTALDPSNPLTLKNHQNTKYKGFKDFLFKKWRADSLKKIKNHGASMANDLSLIRAAFYTPWNASVALPDLKKNADKINTNLKVFWLSQGGKDDIAYNNGQIMLGKLDELKIKHTYYEYPGGHTWPVWRNDLYNFAPLLFKN